MIIIILLIYYVYYYYYYYFMEFTVCHEANSIAARERKFNKYCNLQIYLVPPFLNHNIFLSTVEISVLDFIVDLNPLCKLLNLGKFPESVLNKISLTAIEHSKNIYYNRNVRTLKITFNLVLYNCIC